MNNFFIGSIKEKPSMSDIRNEFSIGLSMIGIVHLIGAKKYTLYSWINDPEKSNSTIKNNIDAISRHFCAHSMGKYIDEEGLPHIFHMCCRAGMLITTFYRSLNDHHSEYLDIRKYNNKTDLGNFITCEELTSLTKAKKMDLPNTEIELRTFIQAAIYNALIHYKDIDKVLKTNPNLFDPLEKITDLDCLYVSILKYASLAFTSEIMQLINPKIVGQDIYNTILKNIHRTTGF